jgi:type I restriction enzyme, S subunit
MKIYAKYKDSGVNWIGDIPEGWGVVRIKIIAKILNGSTPKDKAEFWDGEIKWITPTDIGKIKNEKFIHSTFRTITKIGLKSCGCELCPPNSIVITNRGPIGNVIIPTFEYATNQGCKALLPTQMHNNFFLFYQLKSWSAELENLGQGTTFKELSTTSLKNFIITSPPLKEQEQIVAYLDEKTSYIDKLLDISKRKIGLLKEQRASIINQVVTKGLNPNAKMKHSGVEWIGDIPEGWGVSKLKQISDVKISSVDKHIHEEELSVKVCNYTDVYYNELINNKIQFRNGSCSQDEFNKFKLNKGDVIITKDSESADDIGVPSFVVSQIENLVCGYHLTIIKPETKIILGEYIFRQLQTSRIKSYFEVNANGVTRFGLGKYTVLDCNIILPPLEEQEQIVAYLDEKTSTIDKSISIEERRIGLLKEYRQSIISQVITGKIKVIADE